MACRIRVTRAQTSGLLSDRLREMEAEIAFLRIRLPRSLTLPSKGGVFVVRDGRLQQRDPADAPAASTSYQPIDMGAAMVKHRELIKRHHFGRDPGPNWRPSEF